MVIALFVSISSIMVREVKCIFAEIGKNALHLSWLVLLVASAQAEPPRRTPLCGYYTMTGLAFDSQRSTTYEGPRESYILCFAPFTMTIF